MDENAIKDHENEQVPVCEIEKTSMEDKLRKKCLR